MFLLTVLVNQVACFQGLTAANGNSGMRRGAKNPYSGSGSGTEASDISGAWLTQCDIVEIGKALGKSNDKIMCRVQRPNGVKYDQSINFEFYNQDGQLITILSQQILQAANFYSVEYELPTEVGKSFTWANSVLNPSQQKIPLDYGILSLTSEKLSGSTNPVSGTGFVDWYKDPGLGGTKPDETTCDSQGKVMERFKADQLICTGLQILTAVAGAKYEGPIGKSSYCNLNNSSLIKNNSDRVDLSGGCFQPVVRTIFGSTQYLFKGETGCSIALYFAEGSKEASFIVFDKASLKKTIQSQDDLSYEKLLSHIHGRKCP